MTNSSFHSSVNRRRGARGAMVKRRARVEVASVVELETERSTRGHAERGGVIAGIKHKEATT